MRRMLLLASLVLLSAATARAEPGESKEFKAQNFKWTLPSKDWSFLEPDAELKKNGYIIGVECREDGGVRAFARVVPNGPSAEDIAEEVRRSMSAGLKKVGQSSVTRATLSGVGGSLVVIAGTADSGGALWFRGYAATVDKTLYQVLIEAFNGAEGKRGHEIDAMKRGFRLLAGAGPEEEADVGPLLEPKNPDADDGAAPTRLFPPNGPKLEGRTAIFPSHNLRWTLPAGSPFEWFAVTENEKAPQQQLLSLRAEAPRKPPEGKALPDGEPKTNRVSVSLSVTPLEPGMTAPVLVNNAGLQQSIIQNIFDGKVDASKTKTDLDRKVGNFHGASISMAGGVDKTIRYFTFVGVCLKSERYAFEVSLVGGRDVREAFGQALGALLGGIEFVDTKEQVRGPVSVDAVLSHNSPRSTGADREVELMVPGLTGKKPKGLGAVTFEAGSDPYLRAAYEARSADGMAYFYFDVHTWTVLELQRSNTKLEDLIKKRESEWRTSGGDDAITVAKGTEAWFDAPFSGVKGLGYEFKGSLSGHPFTEQGWVVKGQKTVFWFRIQLGGVGAEKSMDAYVKAVKKIKVM